MNEIPRLSKTEQLIFELLQGNRELNGAELVRKSEGGLKAGSVYVLLGRMADKGFITSRQVERGKNGGLPLRIFTITGQGARAWKAWKAMEVMWAGEVV